MCPTNRPKIPVDLQPSQEQLQLAFLFLWQGAKFSIPAQESLLRQPANEFKRIRPIIEID